LTTDGTTWTARVVDWFESSRHAVQKAMSHSVDWEAERMPASICVMTKAPAVHSWSLRSPAWAVAATRRRSLSVSPDWHSGDRVSPDRAAGILLIGLPIAFNVAFALLAARFDYPNILRKSTDETLARFRQGGSALVLVWWVFALSAVLLAPLAILLARALMGADETILQVGAAIGVLAALAQFLGLIRWPFLVPYLARIAADPTASAAQREAVDVVFQSFNRYLGVAVGEHLGYLLTGAWTLLAGIAIWQSAAVPLVLGLPAIVIGPTLMLCSLEFVGPVEPTGWKLAGRVTPVAYIAWSVVGRHRHRTALLAADQPTARGQ